MIIEKINDHQIKCTLTKQDLESHQIRLSELAYGTDKARQLFQEMMEKAHAQVGFEVDNTPLMIEAIPVNPESIILYISKVDDPEELDTRFSKFAPFKHGASTGTIQLDGADDILDIFRKLKEAASRARTTPAQKENVQPSAAPAAQDAPINLVREFHFSSLENVIEASHGIIGFYSGKNALYKDPVSGYMLVLHQTDSSPEDFNRVCNILSEYGTGEAFTDSSEAYLTEHGDLITDNAVQQLGKL
ncbi:MAG: adaptor protein MecA [Blautia sp.]|nr:adaptor protein MecA [Blautia sp.]